MIADWLSALAVVWAVLCTALAWHHGLFTGWRAWGYKLRVRVQYGPLVTRRDRYQKRLYAATHPRLAALKRFVK